MSFSQISFDSNISKLGDFVAYFSDTSLHRNTIELLETLDAVPRIISRRHELMRAISTGEPELVILQMSLQRDAGLDLVREVRGHCTAPLFVLADGNRDEVDRIVALEMGADACLIQPFDAREIIARARTILWRRSFKPLPPTFRNDRRYFFEGWLLDENTHQLRNPAGTPVPLTKSEFNLLCAFVRAPRRTLSREHLQRATGMREDARDRSIDVRVLRLRRKLTERRSAELIRTERGCGYILDTDAKTSSLQDLGPTIYGRPDPNRGCIEMERQSH